MPSPQNLFERFRVAGTSRRLDLSLDEHLRINLKEHSRNDQSPEIHVKPWTVLLLVGEAQLAGCLKVWVSGPLESYAGIQ